MPPLVPILIGIGEALATVPEAIGLFAYNAVLALGITGGELAVIGGTAIISGVSALLKKTPASSVASNSLSDGGLTTTVRIAIAPWQVVYGRIMVGGAITYLEVTGSTNQFLQVVVTFAGHVIDSFHGLWFDDVSVTESVGGDDMSITSTYAASVSFEQNLGDTTIQPFPNLVSASAGIWTTAHKQIGRAGLHVQIEWDPNLYPGGLPNIRAILQGKPCYDPRDTSTGPTNNAALCILDYLRDTTGYGLAVPDAEINFDSFSDAANVCDESVTLRAGGSEARYSFSGAFTTDQTPADIIQAMLSACAGRLLYIGGQWNLFPGAYQFPSGDPITEADLRGSIKLQTRQSLRDLCNGVNGQYIRPDAEWQPTDFPPYQDSTALSEDQGIAVWRTVQYPFTTSGATAQRLAKIELQRTRHQLMITLPLKLSRFDVATLDTIQVTNAHFGWTNKTFEIIDLHLSFDTDDQNCPVIGVDVIAQETDSSCYDWTPSSDETLIAAIGSVILPSDLTVPVATSIVLASGDTNAVTIDGVSRPRIKVTWVAPTSAFIDHVTVFFTVQSSGVIQCLGDFPADAVLAFISDVVVGTAYQVFIRSTTFDGQQTDSSLTSAHTVTMTASLAPKITNLNSSGQLLSADDVASDGSTFGKISLTQRNGAIDSAGNVLLKNIVNALGATSFPAVSGGSGGSAIPDCSTTITTKGNKVLVILMVSIESLESSPSADCEAWIWVNRDGSQISPLSIHSYRSGGFSTHFVCIIDSPSAGSHTYDGMWDTNEPGTFFPNPYGWDVNRSIQAVELG